jgi:hypothetical protein
MGGGGLLPLRSAIERVFPLHGKQVSDSPITWLLENAFSNEWEVRLQSKQTFSAKKASLAR